MSKWANKRHFIWPTLISRGFTFNFRQKFYVQEKCTHKKAVHIRYQIGESAPKTTACVQNTNSLEWKVIAHPH